ncbi:MAG TPA: hypothetical protein VJR30_17795 [Bradyrhizobium sp.]|nr:hypothetical protein [Bradyrhizobium sp.]
MSNVRDVRDIRRETSFDEADDLRLKNQQLYRLILQLVSDLDELEDALSAATNARSSSEPKEAG